MKHIPTQPNNPSLPFLHFLGLGEFGLYTLWLLDVSTLEKDIHTTYLNAHQLTNPLNPICNNSRTSDEFSVNSRIVATSWRANRRYDKNEESLYLMQACHNFSVKKPEVFFKNVQSKRATTIFQKCRTLRATTI